MEMNNENSGEFLKKMEKGEFERLSSNVDKIEQILCEEFSSEEDLNDMAKLVLSLACIYGVDYGKMLKENPKKSHASMILTLIEFLIRHKRLVSKILERIPKLEVKGI